MDKMNIMNPTKTSADPRWSMISQGSFSINKYVYSYNNNMFPLNLLSVMLCLQTMQMSTSMKLDNIWNIWNYKWYNW